MNNTESNADRPGEPRETTSPHAPPDALGSDRHPLAALNTPAVLLVLAYRVTLSPFLGRQCRFIPTCSVYALAALRTHAPWTAARLITTRIARCHPLGGSGYDPVPPARDPRA